MTDSKVTFFKSAIEFRNWLAPNHDKASELIVGFYKKDSKIPSITWPEAVDQALCFGWIDGIRKNIDSTSYQIRFTPRKPQSIWSAVNVKRVAELSAAGLMQPAGLTAFNARNQVKTKLYSYEQKVVELDSDSLQKFQEHKQAWEFLQSQAPSYQRAAIWWVMSAKKPETKARRLTTLISDSANKRKLKMLQYQAKK